MRTTARAGADLLRLIPQLVFLSGCLSYINFLQALEQSTNVNPQTCVASTVLGNWIEVFISGFSAGVGVQPYVEPGDTADSRNHNQVSQQKIVLTR